jgi:hypothetical protein
VFETEQDKFVCSNCHRLFTADDVYDDGGSFICKGCEARRRLVPTSRPVLPQPSAVLKPFEQSFRCSICHGSFTADGGYDDAGSLICKVCYSVRAAQTQDSRFDCPRCGSPNCQRASLLYASGTHRLAAISEHITYASGGGIMGITNTSGLQQSALAQSLAPPTLRSVEGPVAAGLVLGVMFGGAAAGTLLGGLRSFENVGVVATVVGTGILAICLICGIALGQANSNWNRTVGAKLRRAWERTFVCMRCGHAFTAD